MSASPKRITQFKTSNSTGGNTNFGYEKLLEQSSLRLYSEPILSITQADSKIGSDPVTEATSGTIAGLFLKFMDTTLPINNKESLEVYKALMELLQKRINEPAQEVTIDAKTPTNEPSDDYYERHETPEIANEFINRIKSAPVIPSSYSIYTEEERDLY